jgi:hypothetical protein
VSKTVTIVNFGHPFTIEQAKQIKSLTGADQILFIGEMLSLDIKSETLESQIRQILARYLNAIGKNSEVIINPPGLSIAAAIMTKLLIQDHKITPRFLLMRKNQSHRLEIVGLV